MNDRTVKIALIIKLIIVKNLVIQMAVPAELSKKSGAEGYGYGDLI